MKRARQTQTTASSEPKTRGAAGASGRKRERGSVILIILITLLFASYALTMFIEKASNDLLVETRVADASRLRMEAYSALETVIGVLAEFREVGGALHSPSEGWSDPLGFAGYDPGSDRTVDVTFEDESGKISLPNATASTMVNLFKGWNMPQGNAERLADALLGWMKKDYVATTASAPRPEDYDRGDLPFAPPDRPLRSFSELGAINYAREVFYDEHGQPNDLWQRFASAFSLYSYKDSNINGGNPDLLSGIGVTDQSQQRRLNDYLHGTGSYSRSGPGVFKTPQDVALVLGAQSPTANISTEIKALRINLTIHEGKSSFRLSAVVAPPGGAQVPADQPATAPADPNKPQPPADPNASANGQPPAANGGKKLNYPFTLLEIRENDAISSPPTPAES